MNYILDISSQFNTPENNSFTEDFVRAYLRWVQAHLGTSHILYDRAEALYQEERQRIIAQIDGIPDETMTTLVAETGHHRLIDQNRNCSIVTVLCYPADGTPDPELKIDFRSARPGGGGGSPAGFQVSHPHWQENLAFPCPSKPKQASVKSGILAIFTNARPSTLSMIRRFRMGKIVEHIPTGRSFDAAAFFGGQIELAPEEADEPPVSQCVVIDDRGSRTSISGSLEEFTLSADPLEVGSEIAEPISQA